MCKNINRKYKHKHIQTLFSSLVCFGQGQLVSQLESTRQFLDHWGASDARVKVRVRVRVRVSSGAHTTPTHPHTHTHTHTNTKIWYRVYGYVFMSGLCLVPQSLSPASTCTHTRTHTRTPHTCIHLHTFTHLHPRAHTQTFAMTPTSYHNTRQVVKLQKWWWLSRKQKQKQNKAKIKIDLGNIRIIYFLLHNIVEFLHVFQQICIIKPCQSVCRSRSVAICAMFVHCCDFNIKNKLYNFTINW